jgi:outer membrane receptor protein involved in Fe transport
VRAIGAEIGLRTVAVRRLQSTVSLWSLQLASELVYNGDAGATEPGPASRRYGVEVANYYSPASWLVFDGDVSLSRARFSTGEASGAYVPEAVGAVVSAGVGIERFHRISAGLRLRHFGPRALTEDNSVRSKATTLVNLQGGVPLTRRVRITAALFNLLDSKASDIDYFFRSRLRGEPLEGVEDVHFHPTVPRTLRVATVIGF